VDPGAPSPEGRDVRVLLDADPSGRAGEYDRDARDEGVVQRIPPGVGMPRLPVGGDAGADRKGGGSMIEKLLAGYLLIVAVGLIVIGLPAWLKLRAMGGRRRR
jgi:hypothetical protein